LYFLRSSTHALNARNTTWCCLSYHSQCKTKRNH